jgi:hypothetical protein
MSAALPTDELFGLKCEIKKRRLALPRRRQVLRLALMKSRRLIAFPQAEDHTNTGCQLKPSEQEMATSDMGFKDQFAMQKS